MIDFNAFRTLLTPPYTLVLARGEERETDTGRGVKPLLVRVEQGRDYRGWIAADKVVGRAAAYLYVSLRVDGVYAELLSDGAAEVFDRYGVPYEAGTRVEAILNQPRTALCPMERATLCCKTPEEALDAIHAALAKLRAAN